MYILEIFSYAHPFIPQIFIEHLLYAKHSTRYGDTVARDTVLRSLLLLCSCRSGWRQINHKQRQKKWSEWMVTLKKRKWSDTCPRRHYHTGCPCAQVLSGHSRSQCENTNRNSVRVPPRGIHELCLWNREIWVCDLQISLLKFTQVGEQYSMAQSFYFIIYLF